MRRSGDGSERLAPVGFIDDDSRLTGQMIEGVKVLGTITDLPRILAEKRVEMLVISDADMPARVVREIASFCNEANVRVKTLPGLSDLQHRKTALSQMRDVQIEDLLGRQPVQLDLQEIGVFLRGQRVLVTGAGGSIGSELARQVAGFTPAELVLLDHAENGLYYVHNELVAQHGELPLHPVVADIKDARGIELIFQRFRPNVVFHAAAHKHVPLLEISPREAVLNNVVGTKNLMLSAERHGVGKFVLISTDKAVNPSSVMGTSKRVCEMMLQARSKRSRTQFVAVRFGNVLGSDGSVIPLFQRQIARGGPITVTHPETRRYFMTIPEAVRLVIQAGAIGKGGEVLLLDMGEQVRIVDLARQLIRLSGLREGEDIQIKFTGLRPGEKLFEELHSDAERMRITHHQRIMVWDLDARDDESLQREVAELEKMAEDGSPEAIKKRFSQIVPEYREPRLDAIPIPETPVVSLPASNPVPARPAAEKPTWIESGRAIAEGAIAVVLLALSAPLWMLLWLEVRRVNGATLLIEEERIGRTRRRGQRRERPAATPINRRILERRTRDFLGSCIRVARFRTDAGAVGRFIWRRRLDTVPRLLNVIRGEMVFVGPRPEREETVLRWRDSIPGYERRFTVLPGLTGLAQLSGVEGEDWEGMRRRTEFDLYYVEHRSLLLDIRSVFRTMLVLFGPSRPAPVEVPDGVGAPHAVKGVTQ
jgi:FlaA1/EpsC-like NDP-sugar epimerase/lipopolysaccharide/colanic/teichoic acid biosynthesis glycosyltransferase